MLVDLKKKGGGGIMGVMNVFSFYNALLTPSMSRKHSLACGCTMLVFLPLHFPVIRSRFHCLGNKAPQYKLKHWSSYLLRIREWVALFLEELWHRWAKKVVGQTHRQTLSVLFVSLATLAPATQWGPGKCTKGHRQASVSMLDKPQSTRL